MIFPLGKDLQPWVDFLSLPINDNDILIVVRNSDLSKPLAIRWKDFKTFLVVSGAISVSEDGTVVVNQASNLNFEGAGVEVAQNGSSATITIPGGSGSGPTLQTDGTDNPVQTILNLIAGEYINLTADLAGGVTIGVVGMLSSEIVTFNLGDGPIIIADQSDNHATKIDMGTWDGLSPFNIVYNTKTDPKDGAILEIEVSDTFATDASPAGPGLVNLEVKYGSTTIFNESVDADRAIRFRYEADSDVWFPISYVAVVAPPGSVQSVTGVNVDNTDPANPVVDTFSSFEQHSIIGGTATITLDANATPNHGVYIDFTANPFTSLVVNSYASPRDGALVIIAVNKNGGSISILGAYVGVSSQAATYFLKYNAASGFWMPMARVFLASSSGTVTSVGLAVPSPANPAFTVSGSPVTTSGTLAISAAGTTGEYVRGDGSLKTFPSGSFGVNVGNGQSVILVGQVGYWTAPCDGTITDWAIQSNSANGTVQFDVWKAAGTLPTVANSIVGSGTNPYLTAERYRTEAATFDTLTFSAGDVFGFYVDSNTTLTWAALQIFYNKS